MTIKEICEKYGYSQTALAKCFGIPLRTVQDWYSGRRNPPDYVVNMMVDLLDPLTVVLPCPIGSDIWWVSGGDDDETLEVKCEEGGITGFVIREGEILALDKAGERFELNSRWGCLTKGEAEEIRDKMLKEQQ